MKDYCARATDYFTTEKYLQQIGEVELVDRVVPRDGFIQPRATGLVIMNWAKDCFVFCPKIDEFELVKIVFFSPIREDNNPTNQGELQ